MTEPVYSRCGMRCDLCLVYRPNVLREDRRKEICAVWRKITPGYEPDPERVICDGCRCDSPDAVLLDPGCKARQCVMDRGIPHCGHCGEYPCSIFPAEPSAEALHQAIEVEQRWTWEEEKLMRAYDCKRNMDEFRQKTHKEVQS